jgi:hypothetical protein
MVRVHARLAVATAEFQRWQSGLDSEQRLKVMAQVIEYALPALD